jgi:hypothetical protein
MSHESLHFAKRAQAFGMRHISFYGRRNEPALNQFIVCLADAR